MIIRNWSSLPESFKNPTIKKYHSILRKKWKFLIIKRFFDVLISLFLLVILCPFLLIISIWIKLDSKGPVFYRQVRITNYGREFRIFKFRTMVVDADKLGNLVTRSKDDRITGVGSKIRKFRIDEIPQLLNILKGEMSIVGARPEVKKYTDAYTDEMMATLLLPAGVTSKASILFKNEDEILEEKIKNGKSLDEAYVDDVLPIKMSYNTEYLESCSFINDLKIMCKTLIEVLK